MEKVFLKLEGSTGKFFEIQKEEKEGYEKFTSTTGKVSYRKHYKNITGELVNTEIRDTDYGQKFQLAFKTEDTIFKLELNIFSQDGNVENRYMESIIKFLPNLKKGDTYTTLAYNFIPEGDKYAKVGFSFKKGTEKVELALKNSYYKDGNLVEGDIPAIKWVEKLGKKKPSAASLEVKDEYLLKVLQENNDRLKYGSLDSNILAHYEEIAKEEAPKKAAAVAATIEDDDLPF